MSDCKTRYKWMQFFSNIWVFLWQQYEFIHGLCWVKRSARTHVSGNLAAICIEMMNSPFELTNNVLLIVHLPCVLFLVLQCLHNSSQFSYCHHWKWLRIEIHSALSAENRWTDTESRRSTECSMYRCKE